MKRLFLFILILFSVAIILVNLAVASDSEDPITFTIVEPLYKDTLINTISLISETDIPDVEDKTEDLTEEDSLVEEEPVVPVYDYTEEELDLLARLIFSEGGIESYQTQLMIGSVVMNRVMSDDPWFPDTIREVIYQKKPIFCYFCS